MRPRLLDLFCGAGGAAMGYHQAGFDVTGVDIAPQPRYPFTFIQADVLKLTLFTPYQAIHASPPCQRYSKGTPARNRARHPDLIAPVREMLETTGLPWVIENVPGAPLRPDIRLCGCMFKLPHLRRERWFETSWHGTRITLPCRHPGGVISVTGQTGGTRRFAGNRDRRTEKDTLGHWPLLADWKNIMGIDWMTGNELAEAIPPAYTRYVGRQLLDRLHASVE